MPVEAHNCNFAKALEDVDYCKDVIDDIDLGVPITFKIGVVVAPVVTGGQETRVQDDAHGDKVVKPGVHYDLGQKFAEQIIFVAAVETFL